MSQFDDMDDDDLRLYDTTMQWADRAVGFAFGACLTLVFLVVMGVL